MLTAPDVSMIYRQRQQQQALSERREINKKQTWENNKIRGKFASVIFVPNSNWQMLSVNQNIFYGFNRVLLKWVVNWNHSISDSLNAPSFACSNTVTVCAARNYFIKQQMLL